MKTSRNPGGWASVSGAERLDCQAKEITDILRRALAEDLGPGDVTTNAVLPGPVRARGWLMAQEAMVVAGLPVAERVFQLLDPTVRFRPRVAEGQQVSRTLLAELEGDARALLKGERTALNFLQRLTGIATLTRRFASRLEGTKARLRDTRKTTPGLRLLERYAVRVGGGANHRFGLFDAVLIKENHAQLAGSVAEAVRRARRRYGRARPIQCEVRDENEIRQALEAGTDALLLDNMNVEQVDLAVDLIQGRALVEASGGMQLDNIRAFAECGVDYISVGALTRSAAAVNISLNLLPAQAKAKPES